MVRATTDSAEIDRAAIEPREAVSIRGRPAWRRPRFALGLMLIAGSVALGSWAVRAAGTGEEVWVATVDLAPGDRLEPRDLRPVRVRVDGDHAPYLSGPLPGGAVVVSFVGTGELVPASAMGSTSDLTGRPIAVPLATGAHVEPGTSVDLWAVTSGERSGEEASARLLAEAVQVLGVEQDTSLLRSGSGEVARLLVPADIVPRVLTARASQAALTVVEHPGS